MSTNFLRVAGLSSLVLVLAAPSSTVNDVATSSVPATVTGAPSAAAASAPTSPTSGDERTSEVTLPTAGAILDEAQKAHAAGAPALPISVPSRLTEPPIASVKPLDAKSDLLSRAKLDPATGRLVVAGESGPRTLTVDPTLQDKLTSILKSYETPFAAVVVMDPKTGRVLAMSEHSQAAPSLRGLPLKAVFPAASIFKIVTATALLDAGLKKDTVECSHGGKRRVSAKHLEDSARDLMCMTLGEALGFSANGIFAKLTAKHLTPEKLQSWAERFGFNRPLDFPMPADVSLAAFPDDPLAFAETGAGFGDVFMSPLHGAALASIAATGGLWREPVLFEDELAGAPAGGETASADPVTTGTVEAGTAAATDAAATSSAVTGARAEKATADGTGGSGASVAAAIRVMSEERAAELTEMLEETITAGTARRVFRERGYRVAGAVGKTGSLADKKPFRDYSWFVGFAPKEDPKVAVAAVIVNDAYWRIRATWLGREAMRLYLSSLPAESQ